MTDTPAWVTVEDVITLNQRIVQHTREPYAVVQRTTLESAVYRPIAYFQYGPDDTQDDLTLLGVKLCVGISESQAFVQGNKRTGFAAMEMFFQLNGYVISSVGHGHISEMILATAHPNHSMRWSDDDFAVALDPYVIEANNDLLTGGQFSLGGGHTVSLSLGKASQYSRAISVGGSITDDVDFCEVFRARDYFAKRDDEPE